MRELWAAAIAAILIAETSAHAADWQDMERECVRQVEQIHHCTTACVNSLWPETARCINESSGHRLPQTKLEGCIHQIDAKRKASRACELCGDPAAEALACAAGG